ncbi:MAG: PilN domain-containing protein [Gemmatimonadetes bacterium]|nr:PilN domain-containing protein [Gemmatimonadota bacterium]MDA1103763.1 PilN domain-containing protein [Gemmatimonadota bacterium]
MIEVNLLPGGKKRSSAGGGFSFSLNLDALKKLGSGGGAVDPYMGFFAFGAAIAIGYMGWAFMGIRSTTEDLDVQLQVAVQDSIKNAAIIQRTNELQARGDSIQRRVAIIQDIDAGRYTWPHLLDEIAAAVPDFTWLREIIYAGESPLQVRVTGRASSIFAVTSFMRRLEASRFLRAVSPETMQQVPSEENPEDLVYMFELLVTYESPAIEELESVPLFDGGTVQAQSAGAGN